jgi:hypothetical protein
MKSDILKNVITTLLLNGLHIRKIDRPAKNHVIIDVYGYERFGAQVNYSILFSSESNETPVLNSLLIKCKNSDSYPILAADKFKSQEISSYTNHEFFKLFGGITNTGLVLIPKIDQIMEDLGFNKLPAGLNGDPEDLLEIYTSECLQFLIQRPTRRFGAERLFESLPDGIILGMGYLILTDTKSYKDGFSFTADDIKRFASYVDDFNLRYGEILGKVLSFVVVSGVFTDSSESIQNRSLELFRLCGSKLVILKSKSLGQIVSYFLNEPNQRKSIDWSRIFVRQEITLKSIEKEIKRIKKDNLV